MTKTPVINNPTTRPASEAQGLESQRRFLVTFTETTGYRVRVLAADEAEATATAQDLFEHAGPEPSEGFDFNDRIDGGTDDWEATAAP